MVKFRLYLDKDKETIWLNKMADQGYALKSFFAGVYVFEPCEKGEYSYQIDFGNQFGGVSDDYKAFMEESDIEIVACWGYWVFLRKKRNQGEFELYSDVDSTIEHYKKILIMFKVVTVLELICLMIEITSAIYLRTTAAYAGTFLILAFVIAFLRIIFKTKDTINELMERKTGVETPRRGNVSVFLPIGLLANAIAILMKDQIAHPFVIGIEIVALALICCGVFQTMRGRK